MPSTRHPASPEGPPAAVSSASAPLSRSARAVTPSKRSAPIDLDDDEGDQGGKARSSTSPSVAGGGSKRTKHAGPAPPKHVGGGLGNARGGNNNNNTSGSATAASVPVMMSKVAQGKQPAEVIDLTGASPPPSPSQDGGGSGSATVTTTARLASRPAAVAMGGGGFGFGGGGRGIIGAAMGLHAQAGTRKLVIKNLRAPTSQSGRTAAAEVEKYYAKTWADLAAALASLFAGRMPDAPCERLYRGVEDLCRNGQEERLFEMLRDRADEHLAGPEVLGRLVKGVRGLAEVEVLRAALAAWKTWNDQIKMVRSIFSYLDRSFLLTSKTLPEINDMAISQFQYIIFKPSSSRAAQGSAFAEEARQLGSRLLEGTCNLFEYDRSGDERFESSLLLDSVRMLRVLNRYNKSFEPLFLKKSHVYFEEFAEERASADLSDYIVAVEKLLEREDYRCMFYNLDSSTKRQLLEDAHATLVLNYSDRLLDVDAVAKLLDGNAVDSMQALYRLLRPSGIQGRLKEPWEAYICSTGSAIVRDREKSEEMVVRLLELRKTLNRFVRDAFGRDDDFTRSLRGAFASFINDKGNEAVWGTGTSVVGEMIAKYMDLLLRGGLKTLPSSLLSDARDRSDAQAVGTSATADEDAELDRLLDQGLELFRFLNGKDVFQEFYKHALARRLLMGRSASHDAERSMLGKLKTECGALVTHNLEQMFKDQDMAREEMASYKQWQEGSGHSPRGPASLDLQVNILSAAAWPSYADARVNLPPDVAREVEAFDRYYRNKHTGRILSWKHGLAHCVVKAHFDRGPKELLMSAFQAVVLVLFNEVDDMSSDRAKAKAKDKAVAPPRQDFLSFEQIADATGLPPADLERTLQSLACGKSRVLSKHPKGRDVARTDTFSVNRAFTDAKYRVKINQIQLKESKEENKATHERVAQDRLFETQAAIVRIMKSRKTLTHVALVTEVINQTKKRGAVEPAEIKLNIEKLIEKDYLERDGSSYTYLA